MNAIGKINMIVIFLISTLLFLSCTDEEDQKETAFNPTGTLVFAFEKNKTSSKADRILYTLVDESNDTIYTNQSVNLSTGSTQITTEPIKLGKGKYRIKKLILVNDDNEGLSAFPLPESFLSPLEQIQFDDQFEIASNEELIVNISVVNIENDHLPSDFGYDELVGFQHLGIFEVFATVLSDGLTTTESSVVELYLIGYDEQNKSHFWDRKIEFPTAGTSKKLFIKKGFNFYNFSFRIITDGVQNFENHRKYTELELMEHGYVLLQVKNKEIRFIKSFKERKVYSIIGGETIYVNHSRTNLYYYTPTMQLFRTASAPECCADYLPVDYFLYDQKGFYSYSNNTSKGEINIVERDNSNRVNKVNRLYKSPHSFFNIDIEYVNDKVKRATVVNQNSEWNDQLYEFEYDESGKLTSFTSKVNDKLLYKANFTFSDNNQLFTNLHYERFISQDIRDAGVNYPALIIPIIADMQLGRIESYQLITYRTLQGVEDSILFDEEVKFEYVNNDNQYSDVKVFYKRSGSPEFKYVKNYYSITY